MVNLHLSWMLLLTMSKRKIVRSKPSSKHLNLYQKAYKGGGKKDPYWPIFQDAKRLTSATRVLYPGCHRHLTAALVFPDLTFVDFDAKVAELYSDSVAKEYVDTNKVYEQDTAYRFLSRDVQRGIPEVEKDFDLLISLSAGTIAEPCTQHVKPGGYLLVNDSHSDARTVFVGDNDWELRAYWDSDMERFSTVQLERCFQVMQPKTLETKPLTYEQAQESAKVGTVQKRSFKLLFEPMTYIFQKKNK